MCSLKLDRDGRNLDTEYLSIYRQSRLRGEKGGGKRELGGGVRKKERKVQKGREPEISPGQTQQTSGIVCKYQTFQKIMEIQPMNKTCTNPEN